MMKLREEMLDAIQSPDKLLVQRMLNGFPIVGEVERSARWPPLEWSAPEARLDDLTKYARRTRAQVVSQDYGPWHSGTCHGLIKNNLAGCEGMFL
eukprot:3826816-Amphidinium_carterae.2